ncbi:Protein disulfide isomerase [Monocercomonoides exilis]|uniref:Protein disulfide isomerase n=1 Tax=Monocercomonoides exilis TaxID=2049356 RepID=UPI003559B6B2|nr:Protein disulfide isomerase [Monocercomonoides exilis]|eukprot:MONOS_6505.1-p1 / transcript=MONOS_6505.1 / gene=MONOS_6505 / organism=Monocercomonoides_exilis_PA203 / gene_product=Protein disulfide isomerase / transcript_product=Protein disulfide isomerase / location=Mono_scaffold00206:14385-16036(+) / protein_length=534 / sequence_SO=supercontig / SO=protein_coding / is_pseudo=false
MTDDPTSDEIRKQFHLASEELDQYGLTIGEIDCSSHPSTCKKAQLNGIPEVKLFHTYKPVSFNSEKDSSEIVEWVGQNMEKRVRVFASYEEAKKIFKPFKHAIVGYFPSREAKEFASYCGCSLNEREGDVWVAVVNPSIEEIKVQHVDVAFDYVTEYKDAINVFSLVMWIAEQAVPLVEELTEYTAWRYMGADVPVGFMFVDSHHAGLTSLGWNVATSVAKSLKGKMLFCVVDHQKHWRLTKTLGVEADFFPAFTIVAPWNDQWKRELAAKKDGSEHAAPPKQHKPPHFPKNLAPDQRPTAHYPLRPKDGESFLLPSEDKVRKFCEDWLEGKVPLNLRSEPIPDNWNELWNAFEDVEITDEKTGEKKTEKRRLCPGREGKVVKVVGSTFNESVLDSDFYVFVKFTAPWCEKCKKLAKEIGPVAEEIKDDGRIFIADFDVTTNDVWPTVVTEGYPTLLLFKPEDKLNPSKHLEFYSIQKIRRFLRDNVPNLKIEVDENIIREEDEKKEKEKEEELKKEKEGKQGNKHHTDHHDL